jgi:serine phosphatase RsbU (regulator of sigma subunit)/anti-sigma regulatory factor (Ser/Thr protein kinase)
VDAASADDALDALEALDPDEQGAQREADRQAAVRDWVDRDEPAGPELQAVVRLASAMTGVPRATVNLIDADLQRQLATVGFAGSDLPRDESMCSTTLAIGGLVVLPDARLDPRFNGGACVDGSVGSVRFYAAAPLVTPEGHALGTLCVFDVEPREVVPANVERLVDLADLVVALFDRQRRGRRADALSAQVDRVEQAAEMARTLQAQLLPHELPTSGQTALAARYLPAVVGAEIGGDWYDAVRTDSGVVVVVGDVQGHNSRAAALMGQLRTAVRAYVSEGHSPAVALERTNRLLAGLETDLFATCCLLQLDERTGDVLLASAGHPLPLLLRPADGGGTTTGVLEVEPGPPLGVDPDAEYATGRAHLATRTRLVLYTDGLLDGPGPVVPGGEDGLAAAMGALDTPGPELAAGLGVPAAAVHGDDATLLLLDYSGPSRGYRESRVPLPQDARAVRAARAHLRAVVDQWELGALEDAAELVVSELVTNALVHAGTACALTVRYDAAGAQLRLGVEDGTTSHPQPRDAAEDASGGRGMQIVEAVARRWWVAPHGSGKTVWVELAVG